MLAGEYGFFGSFGGKMSVLMAPLVNRRELGIFIEVFRILKRAETLLLLFCKVVYVKAQQMDMKTGVNMIDMTGYLT